MKKTESIVRKWIRDDIQDIAEKVKKDVAKKLRDRILSDMVRIDAKKPSNLEPKPKETKKQQQERLKMEEEWRAYCEGVRFLFSYDIAIVEDIVELIDEELAEYLADPKKYANLHDSGTLYINKAH
jgi:hypothetical protein